MAGSRFDRIGTIFSRTSGLLKAGGMKYQDRPVWYDIYRVFPPKYEPHIDREAEKKEVINMLYKEDKFRALYFKKYGKNPRGVVRKLNDRNFEEPSQAFVSTCMEVSKSRPEWDDHQVFGAAEDKHQYQFNQRPTSASAIDPEYVATDEAEASKRHGRKPPTITVQSLKSLFQEAKQQQEQKKKDESSSNPDST